MATETSQIKDYAVTVNARLKTRLKSTVTFTLTVRDVILTIDTTRWLPEPVMPY